jgi:RNA polymerase sigma factor
MNLDEKILDIQKNKREDERNTIIDQYVPFIIKSTSDVLNRYIEVENDEEFMVALEAFDEAINRYKKDKGSFLTFSKIVIRSRIMDYLKGKKLDIDEEKDVNEKENHESVEEQVSLNFEINRFRKILKEYDLTFDILTENNPTHKKTRCRCFSIARKVSEDKAMINWIKEKKRLPVTRLSRELNASKRMIKYSKEYILSLVLVYINDLDELKEYINYIGGDCDE